MKALYGKNALALATVLMASGFGSGISPQSALAFPLTMPDSQAMSVAGLAAASSSRAGAMTVSDTQYDKFTQGAMDFVQDMASRGLGFLGNKDLSQSQKVKKFENLLEDSFDMKTIARFALGRYWRTSTPKQRDEYMKLFREMVLKVYSQRFNEYKGQNIEVKSARRDGDKDVIVNSFITSPGNPDVQVDWRVRYKQDEYKVIDVVVEGVSMSVTQRSDFASVIQRGGGNIDVLLAHLRDSDKTDASSAASEPQKS